MTKTDLPIVLFVDDEVMLGPLVAKSVGAAIPGRVKIVPRLRGADALAFLESEDGVRVRLVVVDLDLSPEMTGRELVRRILERWPEMRNRIVVSTGEMLERRDPLFARDGCKRLDKPIALRMLVAFVETAIRG